MIGRLSSRACLWHKVWGLGGTARNEAKKGGKTEARLWREILYTMVRIIALNACYVPGAMLYYSIFSD